MKIFFENWKNLIPEAKVFPELNAQPFSFVYQKTTQIEISDIMTCYDATDIAGVS